MRFDRQQLVQRRGDAADAPFTLSPSPGVAKALETLDQLTPQLITARYRLRWSMTMCPRR